MRSPIANSPVFKNIFWLRIALDQAKLRGRQMVSKS
jgi:hypothetical protein